jgi:hypothetical protein
VLAAAVRSGEERILAVDGDRPDSAFDDIGIDLDPAVIDEENEAIPAAKAITDRLCDRALPGGRGELGHQPGLEGVDEGLRSLLSNDPARLGIWAADLGFDGRDGGDARERLGGNRRVTMCRRAASGTMTYRPCGARA